MKTRELKNKKKGKSIPFQCQSGSKEKITLVAEFEECIARFISLNLKLESKQGHVTYLAIAPRFQGNGIGTALNEEALKVMKDRGIKLAIAKTGNDPSHSPARNSYEKAGYRVLPLVRYFRKL